MVAEPGEPPSWPHVERHSLDIDAGAIEYWFVKAAGRPRRQRRPAVLFAHGNGELIDQWVTPLWPYGQDLDVHLVLVEYRGYGRSAGRPSEQALVADFVQVAAEVQQRHDVDPKRVLYHGRSIGGGVVCGAARRAPPAGLILESTFTDLHSIARRFGAPRILLADRFDNLAALRELRCPCLILHGDADTLIPPDHAQRLFQASTWSRLHLFPGAGHNSGIHGDWAYWDELRALLRLL